MAQKFVKSIPVGYKKVYTVADTYQEFLVKDIEYENRGEASKVLIKYLQSKTPRDFQGFLSNGHNKTEMMELI